MAEIKQLAPEQLKAVTDGTETPYIEFDESVLEELKAAGADPEVLAPFVSKMPKEVQQGEQVEILYYDIDTSAGGATGVIDPYAYNALNSMAATTLKKKTLTWGGVGYSFSVPYIKRITNNWMDAIQTGIIAATIQVWRDTEYLTFKGSGTAGQPLGLASQIATTVAPSGTTGVPLTLDLIVSAYGTMYTDLGAPDMKLDGWLLLPPKIYQNFLGTTLSGVTSVQYVVSQNEEKIVYAPRKVLELAWGTLEIIPTAQLAATGTTIATLNQAWIIAKQVPYYGPNLKFYTFASANPIVFRPPEDLIKSEVQIVYFFQPFLVQPKGAVKIIGLTA